MRAPPLLPRARFGDTITLERRIKRAGGSSYHLQNANGKQVRVRAGPPHECAAHANNSCAHYVPRAGGALVARAQVAAKKDDVEALLDHFCIDAANPLTIITQDMARCFLSGARACRVAYGGGRHHHCQAHSRANLYDAVAVDHA